jgi:hypothetical protein
MWHPADSWELTNQACGELTRSEEDLHYRFPGGHTILGRVLQFLAVRREPPIPGDRSAISMKWAMSLYL